MIIKLLISVIGYFILMLISTNLIGLFIRGLFSNPELKKLKIDGNEFIKDEIKKSEHADKWINIFALILIITYFFILFYFWNLGVVIVALVLMISRLPDLLWEIKHGRKIDPKLLPKDFLYFITVFLTIIALPLLFFFLNYF